MRIRVLGCSGGIGAGARTSAMLVDNDVLIDAGTGIGDLELADLDSIILPGITHWQSPNFFAYFPANAAPASMIAEHLAAAMAAQCMLWQTSPAATELETRMMDWLRRMTGQRLMKAHRFHLDAQRREGHVRLVTGIPHANK